MSDYGELIGMAVNKMGYAEPVSGGDDPIDRDDLVRYMNNAFTQMVKTIGGVERYTEFTIDSSSVITVTKPSSGAPTIAFEDPQTFTYPAIQISNAYKLLKIENLSAGLINTADRMLYRVGYDRREYQRYFEDSDAYYKYADAAARRGILLLPKTITDTNTIGVTYGAKFTRYSLSSISQETGTGLSDFSLKKTGIYTGNNGATTVFRIKIKATAATDTFVVSNDGGSSYDETTPYDCSIAGTTITNGFIVVAGAITGHALDDEFEWTAIAPALQDFHEDEEMNYPPEITAGQGLFDLQEIEAEVRVRRAGGPGRPGINGGRPTGMFAEFLYNRENESLDMQYSL